ncbi:hypothetical protein ACFSO7_22910 [Bacillus sp. CGMCC 1.16607]|uniref:hypothetical protein n=1 Tax=Bacillus sp. CGMCC 1.16607 TaxID=3351842 RepID=UPI00362523EB
MKKVYMISLLLVFLAGCNMYKGNKGYGDESGNAPTPVNYRPHGNVNQDMITDQNPNLLNLNTDENNSTNSQGKDINQARKVIQKSNEFEDGSIWINGDNMHITVYPNGRLSGNELKDAKSKLHKNLMRAVPSYYIHLNIGNR